MHAPGFDSQLSVQTDSEGVKFLLFCEDVQRKTNQGGLTSRKKAQGREMKIYGHSHPKRNIVNVFEKYVSLLPQKAKSSALYKHSLPKFSVKPNQWYADKPVGINVLKKTVQKITEKGELTGYFTNHSLRSSCATRMYAAGVDEQLIMETTGHRSECVRSYKKTSAELLRAAQATVSGLQSSVSADGFGEDIVEVQESDWFDQNVLNEEGETVMYKVNVGGKRLRAHKNPCLSQKTHGKCTDMCLVLKKVDQKTIDFKNKKRRLSLQFKKTRCNP